MARPKKKSLQKRLRTFVNATERITNLSARDKLAKRWIHDMDHHNRQMAMAATIAEKEKMVNILLQANYIPISNYEDLEGIIALWYAHEWGGTINIRTNDENLKPKLMEIASREHINIQIA
ncbi:hypothetical protein FCV25MIE_03376 [Fagus crenata]